MVALEDDPGRDIGMMRYIAHRFFYSADEVEPIVSTVRPNVEEQGFGAQKSDAALCTDPAFSSAFVLCFS